MLGEDLICIYGQTVETITRIMDHFMMFMLSNWLRSKRKIFQSRLAISVLITVNFGNSVILSLEAFGPDSLLSLSVFILNTVVVVLALYGIFAFKPIFLTPNVIAKMAEIDENGNISSRRLRHLERPRPRSPSKSVRATTNIAETRE
ncbi:unnamed protein product [Nippostrongylus brasiliensis]|uniref:G protein-coupled receptor n=1 Tax=Nippostrongylus brasiliensis TaxID=27835 RepID=A0A0N4YPF0_NIPBR|nr:unnamed protein product [Nippostrongylus brasiliensis]